MLNLRAKKLFDNFSRKKQWQSYISNTRLKRCLTTFHIFFFGIGNMIGAGLYLNTGLVIANTTGPAIFLSYALAGIAAFLSALCYAELEGRIPTAGSAYSFSYVVIGELCAFLVGWDMLLKNMIGAAALAKAWSASFDFLIDRKISVFIKTSIGPIPEVSTIIGSDSGPDFLAATIVVAFSLMVCLGSKRSANFNTVFSIFNLCVIVFVICYGLYLKDGNLWTDPSICPIACNDTSQTCKFTSAFMPYGPYSIIKGASQVYFAYIGFNFIASAGEETKMPHRALPYGTMMSMIVVIAAYILMSATLTLLVPFCKISPDSPFPMAFKNKNSSDSIYVYIFVSIGALCSMTTVLFGNLFVLPRTVYAMASDGVLFKCFIRLTSKTQVPYLGVIVFGSIAAVFAFCLKLEWLLETTSLGMLMDYSIVTICVILLRYRQDSSKIGGKRPVADMVESHITGQLKTRYSFLGNILHLSFPSKPIHFLTVLLVSFLIGTSITIIFGFWWPPSWWCIILLVILTGCSLFSVFAIFAHHPSKASLHFKVPLVPFIPAISLFLNIMLMVNLHTISWIRYAVWLFLGFIIYLVYGLRYSKENVSVIPKDTSITQLFLLPSKLSETKFNNDYTQPKKQCDYSMIKF